MVSNEKEEDALRQALRRASSSIRTKRSASTRKKRAAPPNAHFLPSVDRLIQIEKLRALPRTPLPPTRLPVELEKFQRDLALGLGRQRRKSTYKGNSMAANSSSSFFDDEVVVQPHKFEGVFIAKGKNNDAMCTKNLVPGEAVNGEELISVKNKDGIETEYRIWNPRKSKLAAAIQCGVKNIGVDGLVYAVGSSDVVVNIAEKRSNVIPIYYGYSDPICYLMLVSMVDAICADLADPLKVRRPFTNVGGLVMNVRGLAMNALHYLRAGGHFLVFTQVDSIVPTSENRVTLKSLGREEKREFNILEMIKLEQDHKGLVMVADDCNMESVKLNLMSNEDPKKKMIFQSIPQVPYPY
ncbi:rRNA 2'-O-methyltransferase fibrillarin 2 [Linum perenne]